MAPVKVRRTRAELHDLVLTTGQQLLAEIEPTLGFEQLSYGRVFSRIEEQHGVRVTHASVHERIWPSQQAFQFEVLRTSLAEVQAESEQTYAEPMKQALAEVDTETLEGRRTGLAEIIRVGQNANWDAVVGSKGSRIRAMINLQLSLGAFPDDSPARDELRTFVVEQQELAVGRYRASVAWMCDFLGLRPRSELLAYADPLRELGRIMNRTAVSFLLDQSRDRGESTRLPTGPDGSLREWRPVSVAMWNILRGSCEFADEDLEDQLRSI